MLSSLPFFYAFCWSAIPTSCYILNAFILAHVLFFKQQMHAWAEVCHLLQSSKSPLTGFLCSIGWRIIWPDQAFFNSISNSAILRNNYISLLSDLRACVHVRKKWRHKGSSSCSVGGSNRLAWLQTWKKTIGWSTAQRKSCSISDGWQPTLSNKSTDRFSGRTFWWKEVT